MLIALTGRARSGKDTASDLISCRYGLEKYSVAGPLKDLVGAYMGRPFDKNCYDLPIIFPARPNEEGFLIAWDDWELTEFCSGERALALLKALISSKIGITPRQLLQQYGTDVCRNQINKNIWASRIPNNGVVVPDIRFDNEAEFIKSNGGVIVEVKRPVLIKDSAHASEAGISADYIDYYLSNTTTLSEFEKSVIHFCDITLDLWDDYNENQNAG